MKPMRRANAWECPVKKSSLLVILVYLVEFGPWHGVNIGGDIIGLLWGKRSRMVLGHVVDDECRHFCGVVHAGSIVIRARPPDRREHGGNSCPIATVAPGALRSIDGLTVHRVPCKRGQLY